MANLPDAQSAADPRTEPGVELAADRPTDLPPPSQTEQAGNAAIADPWTDPAADETALTPAKTPAASGLGDRFLQGFRSRGWQWLGLALALPFLAVNGLTAWQVRSLTQYSRPNPQQPPLQYQSTLRRLGALALGASIPRPENIDSPAALGFAYETHSIDLGQGEQLEAWYVPAPSAPAPAEATAAPEAPTPEAPTPEAPAPEATSPPGVQLLPSPPGAAQQGLVLLFPAYAASKQTLLQEIKLLRRLGYSTLAVDYRGVGGSSGNDTTLGLREAEDVAASLDYAGQTFGDRPLVVYSRLLGTGSLLRAIAQTAEAGLPQPAAVILENPYDQLFSLSGHGLEALGLPRSPTNQMLTFWGGVLLGGEMGDRDPITYASAVTSPTLVLYGTDESWVSLDQVLAVFGLLPGPKEIVGLASKRDRPLSASASGPWMNKVEAFLEQHLGDPETP